MTPTAVAEISGRKIFRVVSAALDKTSREMRGGRIIALKV